LTTLRRWLVAQRVARMTLETLRLRLLKIGGWVRERPDRVRRRLGQQPSERGVVACADDTPCAFMNNPG
ncbi:MAG: hypothetical protein M3490_12010, partial [Chloroflexota bacterium]|nr:hypothetical protein [Chloroflexota bacterium]